MAVQRLEDRAVPAAPISLAAGGLPFHTANGASSFQAISEDGRYVAFQSSATNVVAGQVDTNGAEDVFLYDRMTNKSVLVSHTGSGLTTAGNGRSFVHAMSDNGRYVLFGSRSTNLVTGQVDTNGDNDVFLYDRQSGINTLVSHASIGRFTAANSPTHVGGLSGDGRYVAFITAGTNLVDRVVDGNGGDDLFIYDRQFGTTTLASHSASLSLSAADGHVLTDSISLSNDGQFVSYASTATNLMAGQIDTNAAFDTFLFNRSTGTSTLISHIVGASLNSADQGGSVSWVSADGGYVAFQSSSTNLITDQTDTNLAPDLFLYNRTTGGTVLISHSVSSTTTTANSETRERAAISDDGQYVFYTSRASNLATGQVDTNAQFDVFRYDRTTHSSTLVSFREGIAAPTTGNSRSDVADLSSDGRFAVWTSQATNIVSGQVDATAGADVFVTNLTTFDTSLISHIPSSRTTAGNGTAALAGVSDSGRAVAFTSTATNFSSVSDTNGVSDVFFAGSALTFVTAAGAGGGPHVKVFNADGSLRFDFLAYDAAFTGGVLVTTGDVTGDGIEDIVTGAGAGGGPHVKVFDGMTGDLVRQFMAYSASFTGGVYVAAGDINDDGRADIITGTGVGGGPHVRAFHAATGTAIRDFFAYDSAFRGGVAVAAGDMTGDQIAEIVTAPGPGGGPHVKVFRPSGTLLDEFLAYDSAFRGGVFVAIGDITGDGRGEIITAAGAGGGPHVKVFRGDTILLSEFLAYDATFTGGVRLAARDVTGDGRAEIITAPGSGNPPNVKVLNPDGTLQYKFLAFDPAFIGGVYVG